MARDQSQTGGKRSTNIQAGRDVHVTGLSMDEARQVALDVYRENAMALRGIAQEVALARAEKLTNEFLRSLGAAGRLDALADPDMQSAVFEAQQGYVRSGEEELCETLVSLLTTRASEEGRSTRVIALNEAITCVPKLTAQQMRAIAVVFALRYTQPDASQSLETYYEGWMHKVILPLAHDLPRTSSDFQHIEYVGAGTLSVATYEFGWCVRDGVEGLYSRGFDKKDLSRGLQAQVGSSTMFVPAFRSAGRLQLNVLSANILAEKARVKGLADYEDELRRLLNADLLDPDEVAAEAIREVPELAELATWWDDYYGASHLQLTTVGYVIGHAYWLKEVDGQSPLSNWL